MPHEPYSSPCCGPVALPSVNLHITYITLTYLFSTYPSLCCLLSDQYLCDSVLLVVVEERKKERSKG